MDSAGSTSPRPRAARSIFSAILPALAAAPLAAAALAGCGLGLLRAGPAPATAPPAPSAGARLVDGELADDDEVFSTPGYSTSFRGDRYLVSWAQAGRVRIFLGGEGARGMELFAQGRAAPAVLELPVEAGRAVKLYVRGRGGEALGSYQLALDPPPEKLEAPLRNDAAGRRARALQKPPDPAWDAAGKAGEQRLASELKPLARDGAPLKTRLEQFAGLETPAKEDFCYRLLVKLEKGATWSELVKRGHKVSVSGPGDGDPRERVLKSRHGLLPLGNALLFPEVCTPRAGSVRFELGTGVQGSENELGAGPIAVEVWARPDSPFARSAAEREAAAAKATRGFSAAAPVRTSLEKLAPVTVPLPRGRCLVAVLRLERGARFSDELRRGRYLSTDLEKAGESVSGGPGAIGPGAVSTFGCMQRAERARLVFNRGQPLGTGPATLTLYTRDASAQELRRDAAEIAESRRDSERTAARMLREACRSCLEQKITCSRNGRGGCYEELLTCTRSHGYREGDCGG